MSLLASGAALAKFPAVAERAHDTKNPLFTDKSEITTAMRHQQQLGELERLAKREYLVEELRDIRREVHMSLKQSPKQQGLQDAQNAAEQHEFGMFDATEQTARLGRSCIYDGYLKTQKQRAPAPKTSSQWWDGLDCSLKDEEYLSKSQRVYGVAPAVERPSLRREEREQDLEELIECSIQLVDQNRLLFAQQEHALLNSTCSMLQAE